VRAIAVNLVRMLAVGAVCGLAGVFVIYGAWRFCTPYAEQWRTRSEVVTLERHVKQLEAERRHLRQLKQVLASPEGVKSEARRLGLLEPGERSLRFMARPEPRATPGQAERSAGAAKGKAASPKPPEPRAGDAGKSSQPDD
jgi:cell division protein FtsB